MLLRDILEFNTIKTPEATAVAFADDRSLCFAELDRRSLRLANGLATLGQPGDGVAILADNCPEYVECYYAVPAARQRLVFLNYRLTPKELIRIVNDSQARVLLYRAAFAAVVEQMRPELTTVEHYACIGDATASDPDYETLLADVETPPFAGADDDRDVAWLIYTSGTTGMPKGAMLSHRNLIFSAMNSLATFASNVPEPRYLMPFPMCHIAGYAILTQHLRGVPVYLMQQFEPRAWLEMVERYRITATALAPTMINMVLNHPDLDRYDTSSLDNIGYGASSIPAEVLRRAMTRFGNVFSQGFGMTELAGNVLFMDRDTHMRAAAGDTHLLGAAGRRGSLAAVRIVDESFNDCPFGVAGEIIVKGDQVLTGYWQRPDAEAEAFQDGWFRTGDMARLDEEGFVYIVDRKKDMIISGGENVYPREVEEVLYRHPAVAEVAVFGVPDDNWGERVTAAIVPRAGEEVAEAELTELCRSELAGYKRPRAWHFVEAIPKNVSGKILKRTLRERFDPAGGEGAAR